MASNSFGSIFRVTTFGESHGQGIGVVIDGCPAGVLVSNEMINTALALRAPGNSRYTSPRKEADEGEILSGVFDGRTTGAPICILIPNKNYSSAPYQPIKDLLRPGHANYTYVKKYSVFDFRGGGRASARETACRVAAGAVAKKILEAHGIGVAAYIKQIGSVKAEVPLRDIETLRAMVYGDVLYCPDSIASLEMQKLLDETLLEGDSCGGVVEFLALSLPAGLGDPVYSKLEATLAFAMMSLPATKGFEIGSGFQASLMKGSEHNDLFVFDGLTAVTATNFAGGTLGGISTGMPLVGRVAFKPTSSIKKTQETVDFQGNKKKFILPEGAKHDPCVAIRAVPVVEAMLAITLVDALLCNRSAQM